MLRGRGTKCSWGGRGGITNKGGGGYQQLLNNSQADISELSTPTSQQVSSIFTLDVCVNDKRLGEKFKKLSIHKK